MIFAPRVSKRAYRLWKYLESLGRYGGWISIKIRTLVEKYDRAESSVKRWFGELYRAGILASKRRGQHPPVYTILIPTNDTSEQRHLFTEPEELEKSPHIQRHQPLERAPKRDDVAPAFGIELKHLANIPGSGVSAGDSAFLAGLTESPEVIRAGVLLGIARKAISLANSGSQDRIRSLRYFAGTIREAANGLPSTYIQRLEQFVRRNLKTA